MKHTMLALTLLSSGCSMLQGLTSKSTEDECRDTLAQATAQFCKAAADNRDRIKAAQDALK